MLPISLTSLAKSKALKTIMTIIIIVILLFVAWKMYQKAKKSIDEAIQAKKNQNALNSLNATNSKDVGGTIVSTAETYTQSDYNSMADALFKAMDGVGTDEEVILKILAKLKTKADWNKLKSAYGTRRITGLLGFGFTGTLVQSFSSELSDWGELDFNEYDMNAKLQVNNILSRFGESIS